MTGIRAHALPCHPSSLPPKLYRHFQRARAVDAESSTFGFANTDMNESESAALVFEAMLNMKASGIRVGLTFRPLREQRLVCIAALMTILRRQKSLTALDLYTLVNAHEKEFQSAFDASPAGTKALVGTLEAIFHADEIADALAVLTERDQSSLPRSGGGRTGLR